MTRLPPTWVLPLAKGTQFDGLLELTSEYVSRKYVVLAEVYGLTSFACQGIMSLNDGTTMQAVSMMSAQMKTPEDGLRQLLVLLCTVPPGWKPGMAIEADDLLANATQRQRGGGHLGAVPASGLLVRKR